MLEAIERGFYFIIEVFVAGRELVAKEMKQGKIDLVPCVSVE